MSPIRQLATILILFLLSVAGLAQTPHGYHVVVRLPLTLSANGIDGELQLLEDSRITPSLKKELWQTGQLEGDTEHDFPDFHAEKPRNGILRVVNAGGIEQDQRTLERPLARLRSKHLYATSRLTYFLTVDYSAGFGSYNGPITSLYEVTNGHLRRVEAADRKTGRLEDISLMSSLKTVWELVPLASGGKEIFLASCRPATWKLEDNTFETTYTRFSFDGKRWIASDRTVKEFNEFEGEFPKRSLFP